MTASSPTVLIDHLDLPAVARNTDGSHLVDVLDPQMDTSRSQGFGQTVVGVIVVVREVFLPAADHGRRYRLCTDVHQPPLVEFEILQVEITSIQGIQDILSPGHQQPYDGALLLGDGVENVLRLGPLQQDRLATRDQAAKPVHLGTGMVERRDAQEHIVPGLPMMGTLHLAGVHEGLVLMQDRLGKSRGP